MVSELRPGRGKVAPGRIDSEIEQSAQRLQEKLNEPPKPVDITIQGIKDYLNTFADALRSVPPFTFRCQVPAWA